MASSSDRPARRGFVNRLLDLIERVGNRLPDPITLFILLAAIIPVCSWIAASVEWTVVHPGTGEVVRPVNLLTREGVRQMFTSAVSNFMAFKPLGVVLVAMLGIGVVERSGLMATALRMMVASVPRGAVSAALVFAGVMSSLGADVGYVVLTPLGAVVFAGLGRHPLAGLTAAFAGVSGGFSANLLISAVDPMLSELTTLGAATIDPSVRVEPTANWWLMIASVPMITAIGWFVCDKIVEPRLGRWGGDATDAGDVDVTTAVTPAERRAALAAGLSFLGVVGVVALLATPWVGVLYDTTEGLDTMAALKPLVDSIIAIMLLAFFVPGLVYGLTVGTIRSDRMVAKMTADTIATMGVYIVLAFAAAQFIAYFSWSNLGTMLAIGGAELIEWSGLSGIALLLAIIAVSAFINLFIGSASAKWALMAPVFVPMLMLSGLSPELTQAAYRIGDSVTNIITPLMPYFPIVIAFGQRYDPNLRLGTLVAAMLPYSIAFALAWTVMLMIWWGFGLPLGPGTTLEYEPPAAAPPAQVAPESVDE